MPAFGVLVSGSVLCLFTTLVVAVNAWTDGCSIACNLLYPINSVSKYEVKGKWIAVEEYGHDTLFPNDSGNTCRSMKITPLNETHLNWAEHEYDLVDAFNITKQRPLHASNDAPGVWSWSCDTAEERMLTIKVHPSRYFVQVVCTPNKNLTAPQESRAREIVLYRRPHVRFSLQELRSLRRDIKLTMQSNDLKPKSFNSVCN